MNSEISWKSWLTALYLPAGKRKIYSYDALSKLKELFPPDTEKGKNIEFVAVELLKNRDESEHIEF